MEALLAQLSDTKAESGTRRDAANAIGSLRAEEVTSECASSIVRELANPHNCDVGGGAISVRRAALLAFSQLCHHSDGLPAALLACVPELSALLAYDDPDVREMAVRAMGELGEHADAVAVAARLEDEESDVRSAAVDTLVVLRDVIGTDDLAAIASRLDEQHDEDTRISALKTLGGCLSPSLVAATHAATVAGCLTDEAAAVRAAAASALGAMGGVRSDECHAGLGALLEDDDASVRAAAVTSLGQLDAQEHADALLVLLGDADRGVRSAATRTLKRWGMA